MPEPEEHFVPILVDECVTNRVAIWLREAGFVAWHVTEVGRRGHPDQSQLEYAAANGMMLLTYNVADFIELDAEWRMTGKTHAGILLANESIYQRNPRGLFNDLRATLRYFAERHGGAAGWQYNQVWWVRRGESS